VSAGIAVTTAASPAAAVGGYQIVTDGRQAVVRNGPGTNYGQVGSSNNGAAIDIACQASGGPAYTGDNRVSYIWDQLNSPYGGSWVTDILTNTPNFNAFSPGIPQCALPPSGGGGNPPGDRFAVTSYDQMRPGAPYHGAFGGFQYYFQGFVAQSDVITYLGVTVGTPNYNNDGHTIRVRLCTTTDCSQILGETNPQITNYGLTAGDIGNVAVSRGATYYIVYYKPAPWNGQDWVAYWWAGGPTPAQSDQMQALVKGYNNNAPPPTYPYHVSGTGGAGLKERTGPGTDFPAPNILGEGTTINLVCQTMSTSVVGGSAVWDKLNDNNFVSDFYTDTPVYANYSPGIPQCAGAAAAPAPQLTFQVLGTGSWGLKKRTGPGIYYSSVGLLAEGANAQLACQTRSVDVENGSGVWDELSDGTWVADGYLNTPGRNQFTAGIPPCPSVPPAPAGAYPRAATYGQTGRTQYGYNPSTVQGDPVNTATGAWWTKSTDVSLPGPGLAFEMTRSYTSASTDAGPLGPGWSDSYATRLAFNKTGDATVIGEQGQHLDFLRQDSGVYSPMPGVTAALAATAAGYSLTRDDLVRYDFDSNGRLVGEFARNGHGVTFGYDAGGLTQATDSAGRVITFAHDSNGLLTQMTLPGGSTVSYGYSAGRLSSVTDQNGKTTRYSYDSAGRLSQVVDGNGHPIITNTYGADGRVAQQADAVGQTRTFAWDAGTETSRMTDSRGQVWTDVYHDNILQQQIDPLGHRTSYEYDGDLNMTATTDGNGYRSVFTYDQRGNTLTKTAPAPLSQVETWAYDLNNQRLSHTDGRGGTTATGYDASGNKTQETAPDGTVTKWEYLAGTDLVTAIVDPLGRRTTFQYDAAYNRVAQSSPLGDRTTFTYDPLGRKVSQVDPRGNVNGANPDSYRATFGYDNVGRLTATTDHSGTPRPRRMTRWGTRPP
jgi:YD repeat-containing protein